MSAGDPKATAIGAAASPGSSETGEPAGPPPQVLPEGLAGLPPGPGLSGVLAGLDPRRLTGPQLVVVLAARNRQIAHEQAQLLAALRELGHAPPKQRDAVVRDREQNPFATIEAAFASTWTNYRSEQMMQLAIFVQEQVPDLGEALSAGRVDLEKVKIFHAMLVGVVDVEVMRRLVALALPGATHGTTAALRARLQRLVAELDPESLRKRRARDHDDRFVLRQADSTGLVGLYGRFLDGAAAAAAYENVDAIAKATHAAGDPLARTMDQLRADIFADLLAGVDPAKAGHATPADRKGTITLHLNLSTLAGLTGLGGLAGPCDHTTIRERTVLRALFGHQTPAGRSLGTDAPGRGGLAGWDGAHTPCAQCLAALADVVGQPGELAGYGPVTAHIARHTAAQLAQVCSFRFAVCDEHGELLAEGSIPTELLPDMSLELRRWAADATAGPDGRAHRRPTAAQIAFVRARDRHCRAPGCRVPAHRCEIDHRIPWQYGGPTLIDNLHCLCKRHHRAKDEGGYSYHPGPGGIAWTTPYGHRYTTQPPDRQHPDRHRRRRRTHASLGITVTIDTDRLHREPTPTPRR